MASQEQKRFVKRHLGHPSGQMTKFSKVGSNNLIDTYLPETGNKFDADDVREMFYNAIPMYVCTYYNCNI
jgi:hypothetical protein